MIWVTFCVLIPVLLITPSMAKIEPSTRMKYTGYKMIRYTPELESNSLKKIENFYEGEEDNKGHRLRMDVFVEPNRYRNYADILIAPEYLKDFLLLLTPSEMKTIEIVYDDFEEILEKERKENGLDRKVRRKRALTNWQNFDVNRYHNYEEMVDFMRLLSVQKPEMVELLNVSRSYEGRIIYGVKIQPPHGSPVDKPSILMDAGVHAREWIAPAVALYSIKKLVENYEGNRNYSDNLNKFNWYIVPQLNPDGYEFSRTTDRMWRKTRSYNGTKSKYCYGADANRNWGYKWGATGANHYPCSNIYSGQKAYSEPEIAGFKDFFTWKIVNPMIYVSLHAYGQLLLSPWGYTEKKPMNNQDQNDAAAAAVAAIRKLTGSTYAYGTITEMMYPASGTSIDFMQSNHVPYIYGVELRPNDKPTNSHYGFELPPRYIGETGEEMLAGIFAMGDHAAMKKKL